MGLIHLIAGQQTFAKIVTGQIQSLKHQTSNMTDRLRCKPVTRPNWACICNAVDSCIWLAHFYRLLSPMLLSSDVAITHKLQRDASFDSSVAVKEYLYAKLTGFEHEVFAVLFLNAQRCLIDYPEMFRGTISSASVYPRELVKEAPRVNTATVIVSHGHPSGNPEQSTADQSMIQQIRAALKLKAVLCDYLISRIWCDEFCVQLAHGTELGVVGC